MCHTDFMNDTLLKSYNRSFNGGKSRFARICDNVFSALLLTAALYLLVSRKLHHGAASLFAAMLISASILLTASLLRSLRFNAHIKKLRRETSESILRRRILVSPEVDEVIRSLHRSSSEYPNQACSEQSATRSFYLLRTEKAITFDDILPIIREALEKGISHIVIYSVSKPEPEAESAVRTVGTTAVEFRLRFKVLLCGHGIICSFVFFGIQILYAVCSLGNDVRRNAAVYPQNNRILQTRRQPALTAGISSEACFIPPAEHSDRGCRPASKARALSEISVMSMRPNREHRALRSQHAHPPAQR